MKKKYKFKRKKKTIAVHTILLFFIAILITISIGYSKLSSILTINGTVTGRYSTSGYDYVINEEDEGTR